MMSLGCLYAEHYWTWISFPPFYPSVSPLFIVLVKKGESYILLMLVLNLLSLCVFGVAGRFPLGLS